MNCVPVVAIAFIGVAGGVVRRLSPMKAPDTRQVYSDFRCSSKYAGSLQLMAMGLLGELGDV